jgi:hypothetical protein
MSIRLNDITFFIKYPIICIKHWWHEKLPFKIANLLPPKVALFTFIRVFAVRGDCHPIYDETCKLWDAKYEITKRSN